jgi:uncharacterized protein (DUF2336 family)
VARDACERATLRLACDSRERELAGLVRDLRTRGQLTPALLLRAVCMGAVPFFEAALAELTGLPAQRVAAVARSGRHAGLYTLCDRAGVPRMAFPAFAAACAVFAETGRRFAPGMPAPSSRRTIDHILARCEAEAADDRLLALLRRFAAEAAREDVRDAQVIAA